MQRAIRVLAPAAFAAGLAVVALSGPSQDGPPPQEASQEQTAGEGFEPPPPILPRIREIMRKACDFLGAQEQFAFEAEITQDELKVAHDEEASDLKVQFGGGVRYLVRRPNAFRMMIDSDLERGELVYDGATATMFVPDEGWYGSVAFDGTIEEALAGFEEEAGYRPPLADFLNRDPCASVSAKVLDAYYIGQNLAAGRICHHMLFLQESIDWQLWVDAGEQPLPRKLVITYKKLPTSPQFTAVFTEWDLHPGLTDEAFAFEPPEGSLQVDLVNAPDGEAR